MTIYYLLIFYIGICHILTQILKDVQMRNKIIVVCGCFGIFLIQALRAETVGIDLSGYLKGYYLVDAINVFNGERLYNYELGYIIYSQIFSRLSFSNQLYIAIVALTVIAPIGYNWVKNSKMPALTLFIYITLGFFCFSFSGIRQSIAIAIAFYSYKFIQERNFVKFLLTIITAMSFHTSAVVFIFAYPLYDLAVKPIYYLVITPLLTIVFVFRSQLYLLIYQLYRGEVGTVETTNAYTMLIVMIAVLVLSYLFGPRDQKNLDFNAYKNYMLVAIFIQIFANQSNIAMRAGYYYYIFITLLIPEVIKSQRDLKIRMLSVCILVGALLYFFQTTTGSGYLNVSPYYFYWE